MVFLTGQSWCIIKSEYAVGGPGARFSKVLIINGPGKLLPFTLKVMTKLSVSETKWSSLLARTRALILYISI